MIEGKWGHGVSAEPCRRPVRAVLVAMTALALAACTGADEEPAPASSASSTLSPGTATPGPSGSGASAGAVALNERVPITAGTERVWPEAVRTIEAAGQEFTLFGVHRIAADRVVVSGAIGGVVTTKSAAGWHEPGYFRPNGGYEFADVSITGSGGARHLPVRDGDGRCLCSLSTHPYDGLPSPQAPAWVVLSAPSAAATVTVKVGELGTIENVPVTDLPQTDAVPFGWEEVLSIESLQRADGVLTARTTIHNPGDVVPTYTLGRHMFEFSDLDGQGCFQGLAAWGDAQPTGRLVEDQNCFRGSMPGPGEQISLDVLVADPGGARVFVLPDAGLPVTVQAAGQPSQGPKRSLRTYAGRVAEDGATVENGEVLTVDLDTKVLFALDKADLTNRADKALAVAAKALTAQGRRSITVAGHTDGQGEKDQNLQLSRKRATAVADALSKRLGAGWDISVTWYGMSEPVAKETGTPDEVEAARARNRRVEITVQNP